MHKGLRVSIKIGLILRISGLTVLHTTTYVYPIICCNLSNSLKLMIPFCLTAKTRLILTRLPHNAFTLSPYNLTDNYIIRLIRLCCLFARLTKETAGFKGIVLQEHSVFYSICGGYAVMHDL